MRQPGCISLSQAEVLEAYRTQRLTKTGKIVEVSIISTALVDEAGQMYAVATTERVLMLEKPATGGSK
jgi:two-component system, chemotaxis family, CheB/CheR fusion protein